MSKDQWIRARDHVDEMCVDEFIAKLEKENAPWVYHVKAARDWLVETYCAEAAAAEVDNAEADAYYYDKGLL